MPPWPSVYECTGKKTTVVAVFRTYYIKNSSQYVCDNGVMKLGKIFAPRSFFSGIPGGILESNRKNNLPLNKLFLPP
jgi:hypothetical protein